MSFANKSAQPLGLTEADWFNELSFKLLELESLLNVIASEGFEDLNEEHQCSLRHMARDETEEIRAMFNGGPATTSGVA